jgi:pyruvate/2-oxoglutarate/acetoin dehydrogenase E1 component
MPKVFFREAICRALGEEMSRDPRVLLLGQDIGDFGGSYKETRGLGARFGASRVRDMPVAEAATVGVAAGVAAAGFRPVAFITYMDFLTLGLDALVNYAAKLRYKTAGQLHAPLVVKTTAGAKGQGVSHSQSFESWLMNVPGLKVVAPSTAADAYGLLKSAIRDDDPVVYIDHKRLFATTGLVPEEETLSPIGRAAVRAEGNDATIVSYSYPMTLAEAAQRQLDGDGIRCTTIDLLSLAPLDIDTVVASVARTGALLVVEEGQSVCGVASEIAFRVKERVPGARVARLGPRRAPISSSPALEAYCLPSVERIMASVRSLLGAR